MSRTSEVVIYNSVKPHPANVEANRLLVKTSMQTTYKIVLFFFWIQKYYGFDKGIRASIGSAIWRPYVGQMAVCRIKPVPPCTRLWSPGIHHIIQPQHEY